MKIFLFLTIILAITLAVSGAPSNGANYPTTSKDINTCLQSNTRTIDLIGSDGTSYHQFGTLSVSFSTQGQKAYLSVDTVDLTTIFYNPDFACTGFGTAADGSYGTTNGYLNWGLSSLSIAVGYAWNNGVNADNTFGSPPGTAWKSIPVNLGSFGFGDCAYDYCDTLKSNAQVVVELPSGMTDPCNIIGIAVTGKGIPCNPSSSNLVNVWGGAYTTSSDAAYPTRISKGTGYAPDFGATVFNSNGVFSVNVNVADCLACAGTSPVNGAIFTSEPTGTVVNENHYARKLDVWLNGGPSVANNKNNCPGKGQRASAGLSPSGDYYFQVTDPPGKVLLSNDWDVFTNLHKPSSGDMNVYSPPYKYANIAGDIKAAMDAHRTVTVSAEGIMTAYPGGHWSSLWGTCTGRGTYNNFGSANIVGFQNEDTTWPSFSKCNWQTDIAPKYASQHPVNTDGIYSYLCDGRVGVSLWPFLDTPNNGGVYKAWATPKNYWSGDASTITGFSTHGFIHAFSKTDNFKVDQQQATTAATTATTAKTTASTAATTAAATTTTAAATTTTAAATTTTAAATTTTAAATTKATTTAAATTKATTVATTTVATTSADCGCKTVNYQTCLGYSCFTAQQVRADFSEVGRYDAAISFDIVSSGSNYYGSITVSPSRNTIRNTASKYCYRTVQFYAGATAPEDSDFVNILTGSYTVQDNTIQFQFPDNFPSPCSSYIFSARIEVAADPTIDCSNSADFQWEWAYILGERTVGDVSDPRSYDVYCEADLSADACSTNEYSGDGGAVIYVFAESKNPAQRQITVSIPGASTVAVSSITRPIGQGANSNVQSQSSTVSFPTDAPCLGKIGFTVTYKIGKNSYTKVITDYALCCVSNIFASPSCSCSSPALALKDGSGNKVGSAHLFVTHVAGNEWDLAMSVFPSSSSSLWGNTAAWIVPKSSNAVPSLAGINDQASGQFATVRTASALAVGTVIRIASLIGSDGFGSSGFCQASKMAFSIQYQSKADATAIPVYLNFDVQSLSNGIPYGTFCDSTTRSLPTLFESGVEVLRISGYTCDSTFTGLRAQIAGILAVPESHITELSATILSSTPSDKFTVTYHVEKMDATAAANTLNIAQDDCLTGLDAQVATVSHSYLADAQSSSGLLSLSFVVFLAALVLMYL